jgi:hypothetical protein
VQGEQLLTLRLKTNIFPYLSRTTFAITKRKRIPLGPKPKASDFFEINPPFPTSNHPDTGIRWWWGSKGNIAQPDELKTYRLPLIDTRLYRTALSKDSLDYLTDYVEDSPLRYSNPYFKPRMEYQIKTLEEEAMEIELNKTEEQREFERQHEAEKKRNKAIDSGPHEPLWSMDQRVALVLEGVVRQGERNTFGSLKFGNLTHYDR